MELERLPLAPAVDQVAAVANGDVSAVELLDATIARYEAFNPAVNAVIVTRLDQARERAAALDRAQAAGEELGPLHGLPMTIKEAFDWVGTPSTWGEEAFEDNIAASNATLVQRVLDAGAVIYGKTNVPVALGDWQSVNPIYGATNNPWDLSRTPGGSSGGSAVSLALGMAGLELGSDIGASIRNPAHYCGVFGHKPTYELCPQTGHSLPDLHGPVDIAVVGPLARSAADLDLALQVCAGPDGMDATAYRIELPAEPRDRLGDFRVGVVLESPALTQDDELTEQLTAAVESLERAGLNVDWGAGPDIDHVEAHANYMALLRAATGAFTSDDEFLEHGVAAERFRSGQRDGRAVVGHGVTLTHREWWHIANQRHELRQRWAAWFDDYDLLLCPIAASAAFEHDFEGERVDRTIAINDGHEPVTDQLFWAGLSCNVYLPGTVAPAGLTRSGLPVGLQIVAPHLHDRRGIAFAGLVERELGGYVPPPGYENL